MERQTREVVIVGAGFTGAILARTLARKGRQVLLLERDRHPRFALGESSTPLANLALERLARRFDLPDLYQLATHGRWLAAYPELRRGRKRGFTFYSHPRGKAYASGAENEARMLVAASPDDEVADTHWLRADVDHHLVREAVRSGVEYRDRFLVERIVESGGEVSIEGSGEGGRVALRAEQVVDGSGAAAVVARQLGVGEREPAARFSSRLLYSHFDRVRPFAEVAHSGGCELPDGPYPDDWAAVHHLLDVGWMYQLRFDHGTVSAGFLLRPEPLAKLPQCSASELWRLLLRRQPSLELQFAGAEPCFPPRLTPPLQYRREDAVGRGWAMLPHAYAFYDPLFSTGIAWGLLAVERLAGLLGAARPEPAGREEYGRLLAEEADHQERLLAVAYRLMPDFDLFRATCHLYFAAASFAESRQRLLPPTAAGYEWEGFLLCRDSVMGPLLGEVEKRVLRLRPGPIAIAERRRLEQLIVDGIAARNVAGLADPQRRHLYPVDQEALVERSQLLGMSREEMRRALPKLRSPAQWPGPEAAAL